MGPLEFSDAAGWLAGMAGALLGWRPDEFWRATPAELATVLAALTGGGDPVPMTGHELTRLKERFPDGG